MPPRRKTKKKRVNNNELRIFDILNDLSLEKTRTLHLRSSFQKDYNPFMVNRFLSMSPDTVHLSLFMSNASKLPKNIQYLFLVNAIDREKRFFKYQKKTPKPKEMKYIQKYFQCNETRAEEIFRLMPQEHILDIVDKYTKSNIVKRIKKK